MAGDKKYVQTLIWSGLDAAGASGQNNIHDLHLCSYRDTPHLCYWQGEQRGTHGSGVGVIMDQRYRPVKTVRSRARLGGASVDFHEFKVLTRQEGGRSRSTALIITYQPKFVDGLWVLDNCFEEVSLDDDDEPMTSGGDNNNSRGSSTRAGSGGASETVLKPLFEWCATDHIGLDENPGRAVFQAQGDGKIPDRPWDFVHLNSIDKSADGTGDYLVSARHLDTIFRISSRDGSVIWRLGGPRSNFQLRNNLEFARQHDARFREDGQISNVSMTISFFNNANDGVTLKDNPSKGFIVHMDLESMTASKTAEFGTVPGKPFIESRGMGNLQQLPNGNTLLTFGRDGAMAEYASSSSQVDNGGTTADEPGPIFYADMTSPPALQHQPSNAPSAWTASNYRTYLAPLPSWPPTHPLDQPPALWTYARTPTNLMTFYVSWNGATDVASYRFWVSDVHPGPYDPSRSATTNASPPSLNFHYAGTWPKQGFETNFTIGSARPWAFVEALDAQGTSLANSSIVRTYVPSAEDAAACGKWHCFPGLSSPLSASEEGEGFIHVSDLLPLDGSAALSGGADGNSDKALAPSGSGTGGGEGSGFNGSVSILGLVEHGFALVGLGLCAWWVWGTACKGWRRARGYERIDEKHPEGL